jgi:hypothetical protein
MTWRTSPKLKAVFGIDLHSLALFRIGIGLLILTDLLIRVPDLKAMYTDSGMFPRGLIRHHYTSIWHWSLHFLSGHWAVQAALFGVAAMLAIALLTGFKTRWAAIGSWLMLMSLHHRVPPILSGADTLMRMLLFWAMFLPLERMWSLDRFLARRRGQPATHSQCPGTLHLICGHPVADRFDVSVLRNLQTEQRLARRQCPRWNTAHTISTPPLPGPPFSHSPDYSLFSHGSRSLSNGLARCCFSSR